MTDPDDGLTRERDRRVQGSILIAMAVMVTAGAGLVYVQARAHFGFGNLVVADYARSTIEVDLPRSDWAHFAEAVDQFATSRGLILWSTPIGFPVKETTSIVSLFYQGDHGIHMSVDVNEKGRSVIVFADMRKIGAEQGLASAFRTDVIESGGFRLLP